MTDVFAHRRAYQAAATATQVTTLTVPAANGQVSGGNLNAAGRAAINFTEIGRAHV